MADHNCPRCNDPSWNDQISHAKLRIRAGYAVAGFWFVALITALITEQHPVLTAAIAIVFAASWANGSRYSGWLTGALAGLKRADRMVASHTRTRHDRWDNDRG